MSDVIQYLRAHTTDENPSKKAGNNEGYSPPIDESDKERWKYEPVFVFDTETTIDKKQNLKVGCAMLCLESKEMYDETKAYEHPIIQKWLFYPNDWEMVNSPEEHETLKKYAQDNNFNLITRSAFINNVLIPFSVFKGYRLIGFNLPFDLSRLAIDCGKTRGRSFRNGFSLSLSENLRVRIKSLGKTASFIRFSTQKGKCKTSGRFVDLKSFTFALTNFGGFTLKTACKTWDTPHQKIDVEEHGLITKQYLDYLVNDVLCTYDLWGKLNEDYRNYP